jgi:hypothetical protein
MMAGIGYPAGNYSEHMTVVDHSAGRSRLHLETSQTGNRIAWSSIRVRWPCKQLQAKSMVYLIWRQSRRRPSPNTWSETRRNSRASNEATTSIGRLHRRDCEISLASLALKRLPVILSDHLELNVPPAASQTRELVGRWNTHEPVATFRVRSRPRIRATQGDVVGYRSRSGEQFFIRPLAHAGLIRSNASLPGSPSARCGAASTVGSSRSEPISLPSSNDTTVISSPSNGSNPPTTSLDQSSASASAIRW